MRLSLIIKDSKITIQPSSQADIPLEKKYIKIYALGENSKKKNNKKKSETSNRGRKNKKDDDE